jgi:hypothetical protein
MALCPAIAGVRKLDDGGNVVSARRIWYIGGLSARLLRWIGSTGLTAS